MTKEQINKDIHKYYKKYVAEYKKNTRQKYDSGVP